MVKSLDLLMVPTVDEWVVLPQVIVRNVFPYAPSLSIEEGSEFVIGSLLMQNEIIPFVDFDFQQKREKDYSAEGFRIVLVATISSVARYPYYALLAHGEPIVLKCEAGMIQTLSEGTHPYVAQQVSIHNDKLAGKISVVLNLPAFESALMMR